MTIFSLVGYIGVLALAVTIFMALVVKNVKSAWLSYLQNFSGILFVFSGWVKAIDPLGTAFKMQQYFDQFEVVFSGSFLSFMAPLFPALNQYTTSFSVFMIIFEIVLGIMLVIGAKARFTAWAFFLLVVFFTILTGFTYLTGYVPEGVNFFSFGDWGPYQAKNMKVTDCGCFGDFIKLEPKISFIKDLVLLVPAIAFVALYKDMHRLFSSAMRIWISGLSVPALLVYCFSNYVWNLPDVDFRPFREGVNIPEKKRQELEAMQNVKITAYRLTNKADGRTVEIPFDQFLKEMSQYPSEKWEMEQIKSAPAIAPTKVSEFEVANLDGQDVTEELLSLKGYYFLIIAYHLEGEKSERKVIVRDTTYVTDTARTANSIEIMPQMKVVESSRTEAIFSWEEAYQQRWTQKIVPLAKAAEEEGIKTIAITAYAGKDQIEDFRNKSGISFPFLVADDILLKTIVRSNPGTLLMKDGTVVKMWHHRQLPDFDEIRGEYIR